MISLTQLAARVALLSLVAVGGGNAVLPQVYEEFVARSHALDDRTFTELVVLAQIAPGPNLMFMPLIGWRLLGWGGALVALIAFVLPSSVLAVIVARWWRGRRGHPLLGRLRRTLRPVAGGLLIASAAVLLRTTVGESSPLVTAPLGAALLSAVLTLRTSVNPLALIAVAALLGAVTV